MSYDIESPATGEPGNVAGPPKDRSDKAQLPKGHSIGEYGAQANNPPGLIGFVRQFIFNAAPYPNSDIALAGAIALLAGISGRAYNTYTNAGLNQYILLLASTGLGKEAAATGISKLLQAVSASVPAAGDFKGPAFVSSAGLVKWLDKKPSVVTVAGEFGYMLNRLSSPKANPNDQMLKATLLDLYGKSGAGSVLDPMAYSDRDKQTGLIHSPALTLLGESVPGIVYEGLGESTVLSGLLPRFMVIEAKGQRSSLNESPAQYPCPQLIQGLADLCAQCLALNSRNAVQFVEADAEAKAKFSEFAQWVTDQINSQSSETLRELWNRAHLKALKLASLCAVGINYAAPVVTIHETMWATSLIVDQTNAIIAKFANGETGTKAGSEAHQLRAVIKVALEYVNGPASKYENYGCTEAMHRMGIFTQSYLSRRLINLPTFAEDKLGPTNALKRALKNLLEADDIREIPTQQMVQTFGVRPRAFAISNPRRFLSSEP
jgi:hypothetical protein